MGLFEKRRARKFFIFVQDYEESDPKSHEGMDLNKVTARDLISYFLTSFSYSLPHFILIFDGKTLQVHSYPQPAESLL